MLPPSTAEVKAKCSSETCVNFYQTSLCYIPTTKKKKTLPTPIRHRILTKSVLFMDEYKNFSPDCELYYWIASM
jgi:hypothetical protein